MIHHIFDMSTASISEGRVVIRSMAKKGISMGIYYFINQKNQKFYVGSTFNFYNRLGNYFNLKDKNQVIVKALTKYGFSSFTLILIFIPNAIKEEVLALVLVRPVPEHRGALGPKDVILCLPLNL
jgi:hypothetical protein